MIYLLVITKLGHKYTFIRYEKWLCPDHKQNQPCGRGACVNPPTLMFCVVNTVCHRESLRSSKMLLSIRFHLLYRLLEQPVGPVLKGQAVPWRRDR